MAVSIDVSSETLGGFPEFSNDRSEAGVWDGAVNDGDSGQRLTAVRST